MKTFIQEEEEAETDSDASDASDASASDDSASVPDSVTTDEDVSAPFDEAIESGGGAMPDADGQAWGAEDGHLLGRQGAAGAAGEVALTLEESEPMGTGDAGADEVALPQEKRSKETEESASEELDDSGCDVDEIDDHESRAAGDAPQGQVAKANPEHPANCDLTSSEEVPETRAWLPGDEEQQDDLGAGLLLNPRNQVLRAEWPAGPQLPRPQLEMEAPDPQQRSHSSASSRQPPVPPRTQSPVTSPSSAGQVVSPLAVLSPASCLPRESPLLASEAGTVRPTAKVPRAVACLPACKLSRPRCSLRHTSCFKYCVP